MAKQPQPSETVRAVFDRPIGDLTAVELAQAKGTLHSIDLDAVADVLDYNLQRTVQELIDLYQSGDTSKIQSKPEHKPKRRVIKRTTAPISDKPEATAAGAVTIDGITLTTDWPGDTMPDARDEGRLARIADLLADHPGTKTLYAGPRPNTPQSIKLYRDKARAINTGKVKTFARRGEYQARLRSLPDSMIAIYVTCLKPAQQKGSK